MNRILVVLLLLMVFPSVLRASTYYLDSDREIGLEAKVIESNTRFTKIEVRLKGFESTVDLDGYVSLSVPGLYRFDQRGYPALPRWTQNVAVPEGSTPTISFENLETELFKVGRVRPSKGPMLRSMNPHLVPLVESEFYGQTASFPSQRLLIQDRFEFRDTSGVTVRFSPFQLDGKDLALSVVKRAIIRIDHASRSVSVFKKQNRSYAFEKLYQRSFLNYDSAVESDLQSLGLRDNTITDTGKVLIISAPQFFSGMNAFVQWKTQKGLTVEHVTTNETGSAWEDIKAFIADRYHTNAISYVILVGDASHVDYHRGNTGNALGNEADPMYGLITGNDSYPEVMISRISVETAEDLENVTEKIINYELNPEIGADWYAKASGIASDEGNPSDGERAEWIRQILLGYTYTDVDQFYDPGITASQITAAVNEGRGFLNYLGHGTDTAWVTGWFGNSHIDQLQNGSRHPVIVSVACVNGNFSNIESFAERWLKVGSVSDPQGAVAVWASSTNQAWVEPTLGQKSVAEHMATGTMDTVGMLFAHGAIEMLETGMYYVVQTFETWHTFGDATMQVRSDVPSVLVSQVPEVFSMKSGGVSLNVGLPGIQAGVTKDGQLLGAGVSDESGHLEIPISVQTVQDATLTLTGNNIVPVIAEIDVI